MQEVNKYLSKFILSILLVLTYSSCYGKRCYFTGT
jgi:hypothetical protein